MPTGAEVRLLRLDELPPAVEDLADVAWDGGAPRSSARSASTVARSALRIVVAERTGCPVAGVAFGAPGPHGRPRLAGVPPLLDVNLSHSGPHVAVAVGGGTRVGVDVERVAARRDLARLARRVLTSAEHRRWSALPAPEQLLWFLRTWTRKEAQRKAEGSGLAGGVRNLDARTAPAGWSWTEFGLADELVGTVAVGGDGGARVVRWGRDGALVPVA